MIGGTPVLATCAGVILIARRVRRPEQRSLGLLDVEVERNAYGRQLDSAVVTLRAEADELGTPDSRRGVHPGPAAGVPRARGFAPWPGAAGTRCWWSRATILAATFHPELSVGSPVVDRFVGARPRTWAGRRDLAA